MYTCPPTNLATEGQGSKPTIVIAITGSESFFEAPGLWWKYNIDCRPCALQEELYGKDCSSKPLMAHKGFTTLNE
jgi:hypothetical protein